MRRKGSTVKRLAKKKSRLAATQRKRMTSAATHFALHDGQLLRHEMKTKAVAKLAVASEMVGVGGNGQTRKKNGPLIEKKKEK